MALPVVALWLVSPAIAWWLSRPLRPRRPRLSAEDYAFLRTVARRTWRFFETFVGPADNHLPPDNFQEDPPNGPAHRTSPTNIGLALLSNLAAYDFGYITAGEVIGRTSRTLGSIDRLQRYRGHLFNWYDTRTLEPLRPLYVSTVDSGNLAGHLLTLAAGLNGMAERADLPPDRLRRPGRDAGRPVATRPAAGRGGSAVRAPAVPARCRGDVSPDRVRDQLRTTPPHADGVMSGSCSASPPRPATWSGRPTPGGRRGEVVGRRLREPVPVRPGRAEAPRAWVELPLAAGAMWSDAGVQRAGPAPARTAATAARARRRPDAGRGGSARADGAADR